MSLSRPQQIRLKRAQQEARLDDADYREAIATISGMADCRSSTDPRLTDGHWDNLLAYFEAIFWRKLDAGHVQLSPKHDATFQRRGYWAAKNRHGDTSRDRYVARTVQDEVSALEAELTAIGCGLSYLRAIQNRMQCGGKPFSLVKYAGALKRTLAAKQSGVDRPF
jgi:hypothetical protein